MECKFIACLGKLCRGGMSALIRNIPTLMAVKVEGEKRLIILD